MKKLLYILSIVVTIAAPVSAQQIFRSEFIPYDTREDALTQERSRTVNHIVYAPKIVGEYENNDVANARITIPTAWVDYDVYIHIENPMKAYRLMVGNSVVAEVDDPHTPADFLISPYIRQGENDIMLLLHTPDHGELNDGSQNSLAAQFENCYIYAQYRTHVHDYDVSIRPDAEGKVILALDAILSNSFGTPQPVTVGYDIYSPEGKLIDYAVREQTLEGNSLDTMRFRTALGTVSSRGAWGEGRAPLYRVMLYTKRDGKPREYIPFRAAQIETSHANGHLTVNGKAVNVKSTAYDARTTRKEVAADIRALKMQGYNTLLPSRPQPEWFYDLCDAEGMYVIEQANINPTRESGNRKVGGTPSNDPSLAKEYVARVQSMYWRTRNHPCIIAYSLCGDKAGNGHCLYAAYRWLKGIEKERAVICRSANGEWNTDIDIK